MRLFSFDLVPRGWAECNGQLLLVQPNQALFSLLGATYGGDGKTTFALPDLRSRTLVGVSQGGSYGAKGGTETVTLTAPQIPAHAHTLNATSNNATTANPTDAYFGKITTPVTLNPPPAEAANLFGPGTTPQVALNGNSISSIGGGQPHDNRQPYLALNWCICITGAYPPRP